MKIASFLLTLELVSAATLRGQEEEGIGDSSSRNLQSSGKMESIFAGKKFTPASSSSPSSTEATPGPTTNPTATPTAKSTEATPGPTTNPTEFPTAKPTTALLR
jgi:cell division septation protein DedD